MVVSADQVSGIVITRSTQVQSKYFKENSSNGFQDGSRFRAHYNLEDFLLYGQHTSDEHMILHHFVVNPIFQHRNKFILREVMRQMKKACVYYRLCYPGESIPGVSPSTITPIIDDMIPLRRRRQIAYSLDNLKGNAPSARLRDDPVPHSVLFLNKKLMLEPKITVNTRIVVVGASDTGLAFLESLIYRFDDIFNCLYSYIDQIPSSL